jgi:beta-glucosidase
MAQAKFSFPRGFLWGTATSSYQVEGNNLNSNWYTWEEEGNIIHEHSCGLACDWWGGRWSEDFDRAVETHQNAHRLSIEWSRVQPNEGKWDENALDYYRQIIRGLVDRGLTPLVTLHHFSDPLWLSEQGGWENPKVVEYFETFTRKVVEALQEYSTMWITINEPNVYFVSGYIFNDYPPGKTSIQSAYKVITNMTAGHAAAYHAIHEIQPEARVGIAIQQRGFRPGNSKSPLDKFLVRQLSRAFNDSIPDALHQGVLRFLGARTRIAAAKGTQDFLGINYYTIENLSFQPRASELFARRHFPTGVELSASGDIANEPEGMFSALKWGGKFKIPIIVTENGIDDAEDALRPKYLAQHIHQVWRAVNFNWPIKGYFHWTLVDNFEWERGWTQRFGLWELDIESQVRKKRPSVDLYAAICKENAISSDMVAQYVPELLESMFPG